jgi:hypothetical protein
LCRRVVLRRQHQRVGHRLDPAVFLEHRDVGGTAIPGRAQIERARAPLPRADHAQANIGRDAIQPGAQARARLEGFEAAPRAQKALLHRVFGFERRAEHAVAVASQLHAMRLEQRGDVAIGRGEFLHARGLTVRAELRGCQARRVCGDGTRLLNHGEEDAQ